MSLIWQILYLLVAQQDPVQLQKIFFLVFGLLLLILAVRKFFGEDDPETPPPKFMTVLDEIGPVKLFGLGIAICIRATSFYYINSGRCINNY